MHKVVPDLLLKINNNQEKVYFEPLGGNNGDCLIELGALQLLKKHKIQLVKNIEEADVILINGSGDLSYHAPLDSIENTRQASILLKYPNKKVILLPSSCTSINAGKLGKIVDKRNNQTILIARDEISFGHLKKIASDNVEVFCDHDMAFALLNTDLLKKAKEHHSKEKLLIIERFDRERATNPPLVYKVPISLRSLIPSKLKQLIKQKTLSNIHQNTTFVKESTQKVDEIFSAQKIHEIKAADISLPQNHSFEEFIKEVVTSSIVVSTRLHGCILAALLGKKFIAVQFEGGEKILGVFEKSLHLFDGGYLWIKPQS